MAGLCLHLGKADCQSNEEKDDKRHDYDNHIGKDTYCLHAQVGDRISALVASLLVDP